MFLVCMTRRRNLCTPAAKKRGGGLSLVSLVRIPTSSRRDSTCITEEGKKIPCSYPIRLDRRYSAGRIYESMYRVHRRVHEGRGRLVILDRCANRRAASAMPRVEEHFTRQINSITSGTRIFFVRTKI